MITLQDITYAYWSADAPEDHSERTREDLNIVFEDFSLSFPPGISSVLGENGIGKTTLLLLAGARLFPARGTVSIQGQDSLQWLDADQDPEREEGRNRLVSFVHQNMEFETDESLGGLLEGLLDAAPAWSGRKGPDFGALSRALDLEACLGRRPQALSKGELQRGIIGLAVAYGSPILIMDEPVFAMEDRHKERCFDFLREWCHQSATQLIYTAHDIHLCRDWADQMVLLSRDKSYRQGPAREICTEANLEAAYRVPIDTLYQKERLYREMLSNKSPAE